MQNITSVRLKRFFLSCGCIIALRALDLFITYRYTPTLSAEWNPLVSLLGAGWTGLILSQVLVLVVISCIIFFYFAREEKIVSQPDLSFQDFVYVYFWDKLKPWPARMFSVPKNIKRHLAFLGFVFLVLAISISVFAIIHNLLLIAEVRWYCFFVGHYYKVYFPVLFGGATLVTAQSFFIREYYRYKRMQVKNREKGI